MGRDRPVNTKAIPGIGFFKELKFGFKHPSFDGLLLHMRYERCLNFLDLLLARVKAMSEILNLCRALDAALMLFSNVAASCAEKARR